MFHQGSDAEPAPEPRPCSSSAGSAHCSESSKIACDPDSRACRLPCRCNPSSRSNEADSPARYRSHGSSILQENVSELPRNVLPSHLYRRPYKRKHGKFSPRVLLWPHMRDPQDPLLPATPQASPLSRPPMLQLHRILLRTVPPHPPGHQTSGHHPIAALNRRSEPQKSLFASGGKKYHESRKSRVWPS